MVIKNIPTDVTNEGDDIAVYPEVSVILNIVKDPALGRRGALASVATVARYESATCDEESFSSPEECTLAPLGLSPQRRLTQRDVCEILHSVQDDNRRQTESKDKLA